MSILSLNSDAEQIVLKVSSSKCKLGLTSMDESVENYYENMAPDSKYTTNITIEAFAVDYNEEKVMDIGFLEAVYFEAEVLFGKEISFPMLCDMISSDAYTMAEAVTDKHGKISPSICHHEYNMMYIEKLFIEEQCRGYGVGRYLLNNLIPLLSNSLNLRPHVCVLAPYPQEKTQGGGVFNAANADAGLPRLIRFYEKAGYTKLDGCDYMMKKFTSSLNELFAMMEE